MGAVAVTGLIPGHWFFGAIILLAFLLALDSEKRATAAEAALAALRSETPPDSMAEVPDFDEPAPLLHGANVVPLRRPVGGNAR